MISAGPELALLKNEERWRGRGSTPAAPRVDSGCDELAYFFLKLKLETEETKVLSIFKVYILN